MIDLTQAPYNVQPDWTGIGSDGSATDWGSAITDAIAAANETSLTGLDMAGIGEEIILPLGGIMCNSPIVVPAGVILRGVNRTGSVIKMGPDFPADRHFIDLGDESLHSAQFGGKIQHMTIVHNYEQASLNKAMLYTSNMQDTDDMWFDLTIYGGRRQAMRGEIGWGGASFIHARNILYSSSAQDASSNALAYFGFDPATSIYLERFEPAAGMVDGLPRPNTKGLMVKDGTYHLRGLHGEQVSCVLNINMTYPDSLFRGSNITGHPTVNEIVQIEPNSVQTGRIRLDDVRRYSATGHFVIRNQISGGTSSTTDVITPQVF